MHCAIFTAASLAMLLGTKNKKCVHVPLLKTAVKLRNRLLEG